MRKSLRYYFRLSLALVLKQRKIILLGIFFGVFVFYFFPKIFLTFPRHKQIKIGLVGKYTQQELPPEILNLISLGLTEIESNGSVKSSLASSWETKNSEKEYIFTLKENLTWQDGSPIKAKDINYNFSDVATSVIDERTISFQLRDSFSPFPTIVSRPIFKNGLLGCGNYKVKSIKKLGQIIKKLVLKSKNSTDPLLIYSFYPSEEAVKTAFKLGEISTIKKITDVGDFNQWTGVKISRNFEESQYVAIFLNTQNKFLEDKSLRQALAYAIKKPWESRATTPINQKSWAYNPSVKPYNYDLENANERFSGSQENKGETERFNEIELSTVPSLLTTAEAIANDWKALNLKTNIKVINEIPEDFQALLIAQEIPIDPDQYTFWHSTQALSNLSHYKNPKIDKLLEDGRKTSDQGVRKNIYFDFQRFIVEDTPAIFLYHPVLFNIERN